LTTKTLTYPLTSRRHGNKNISYTSTQAKLTHEDTSVNKLIHNTIYTYTVRHKKLHPSYWYNNFAKLCHTVMIFGMHTRISYRLPVWQSL